MSGRPSAPTFGTLLFSDVERGVYLYEEPNYESRLLSTYLPSPLGGLFAGGQVARFNDRHEVMDNVCVVGMLKASTALAQAGQGAGAGAVGVSEEGVQGGEDGGQQASVQGDAQRQQGGAAEGEASK